MLGEVRSSDTPWHEMDPVYHFNKDRWEALVKADALFTRPWLNETSESARQRLDPSQPVGRFKRKRSSVPRGRRRTTGSRVRTEWRSSFSARIWRTLQLQRDIEAARHYGYAVKVFQGDMRNLSMFNSDAFEIVSQPYSLNFVPDCGEVFPAGCPRT